MKLGVILVDDSSLTAFGISVSYASTIRTFIGNAGARKPDVSQRVFIPGACDRRLTASLNLYPFLPKRVRKSVWQSGALAKMRKMMAALLPPACSVPLISQVFSAIASSRRSLGLKRASALSRWLVLAILALPTGLLSHVTL